MKRLIAVVLICALTIVIVCIQANAVSLRSTNDKKVDGTSSTETIEIPVNEEAVLGVAVVNGYDPGVI